MDSAGPAKNIELTKRKKEITHTEDRKNCGYWRETPKETETGDKATTRKGSKDDRDGGSQGNGKSNDGSSE